MALPWDHDPNATAYLQPDPFAPAPVEPQGYQWPPPGWGMQQQPPPVEQVPVPVPVPVAVPPDAITSASPVAPQQPQEQALLAPAPANTTPAPSATPTDAYAVNDAQTANNVARADARAGALGQQASVIQERLVADQQAQAEAKAKSDAWEQNMMTDLDALKQMRVDPSRLYANMGTAGQVANAAGAFLSGLMAPFNGGRNMLLERADALVAQDIASQREDMANGRANLQASQSLYSQYLGRTGDEAAARTAMTLATLQGMQAEATAHDAMFDSPDAKLKGEQVRLAIQDAEVRAVQSGKEAAAKAEMEKAKLANDTRDSFTSRMNAGTNRMGQQETSRHNKAGEFLDGAKLVADQEGKTTEAGKEERGLEVFGVPGLKAPTVKVAEAVNEMVGAADDVAGDVTRLRELYKKASYTGSKLGSGDAKRAEEVRRRLMAKISVLHGQGAVSEGEARGYGEVLGNVDSLRSDDPRLDELVSGISRGVTLKLRAKTGYTGDWSPTPLRPPGAEESGTISPTTPQGNMAPTGLGPSAPEQPLPGPLDFEDAMRRPR